MTRLAVLLLATAIAAAGCGPSLTSGTVVSIGVLPAHWQTTFISVAIAAALLARARRRPELPDRDRFDRAVLRSLIAPNPYRPIPPFREPYPEYLETGIG